MYLYAEFGSRTLFDTPLARKNRLLRMKHHGIFGAVICSILAMTTLSCEKSDMVERFPEGTSMLKMMNEDNGRTTLGNSNVYITSSLNFKSGSLPILDCGKKDGIGDIGLPDFANMAPEVAVRLGHGYVICDSKSVDDFPSRNKAIREDALMYRVYADSWITNDKGNTIGANVYFLLGNPLEHGQMPEMGSNVGTLSWNLVNNGSNTISIKLPSEDIEVDCSDSILAFSTSGKKLTIKLSGSPMSYEIGDRRFRIRSGRVYTEAVVSVNADTY